jgi:hypothetical protein
MSRIAQQSTIRKNNAGVLLERYIIFPCFALRTKNENTTMAQGNIKKEQAAICKVALEKKGVDTRYSGTRGKLVR